MNHPWPAAAVGYALEKAANLGSPVVWSQTPDTVQISDGQNVVTLTNVEPAAFYLVAMTKATGHPSYNIEP